MPISEMQTRFNYVPWLEYINTMLEPYKKMNFTDTIIVRIPTYYEKLENVLRNTPKRYIVLN